MLARWVSFSLPLPLLPATRAPQIHHSLITSVVFTHQTAENAHSFAERSAVKDKLKAAFAITKTSTASVGKFDHKLADEISVKKRGQQKKRDPVVGDMAAEKQRALAVLAKVGKKPVTINTRKGARAADDVAPGGVGKSKVKKQQTRFAAKGPSKKQKKQGMK